MQFESWLNLTDYSSKYRVSVSTLRRRIKAGQVLHRLEQGKYLIVDAELPETDSAGSFEWTALSPVPGESPAERIVRLEKEVEANARVPSSLVLQELKRAYMSVLQEREEQILHLKEEVSDLKTLVRVLEDDNDRLRGNRVFRT